MRTPHALLALLLMLLALPALVGCAGAQPKASAPSRSYDAGVGWEPQEEQSRLELTEPLAGAPAAREVDSAEEGMALADSSGGGVTPPPAPPMNAPPPGAVTMAAEVQVTSIGAEMYRAPSGGGQDTEVAAPAPPPPPPPPPPPQAGAAQPPGRGPSQAAGPSPDLEQGAEVAVARKPMLIYIAGMWLVVDDVAATLSQVEAMARELGGYLGRRDDASITIRVPAGRFDEALARVEQLGEVRRRDVSAEDVTEEYLDLEIRLKNLRAVRARLEKLLERAKTVEEAVLLERELARVAGEIDRIEGRMKFLQDRAAYSTITVHAQPRPREAIGAATPRLPVPWLGELGLGRLLRL